MYRADPSNTSGEPSSTCAASRASTNTCAPVSVWAMSSHSSTGMSMSMLCTRPVCWIGGAGVDTARSVVGESDGPADHPIGADEPGALSDPDPTATVLHRVGRGGAVVPQYQQPSGWHDDRTEASR